MQPEIVPATGAELVALVIAAHGRHFLLHTSDNGSVKAVSRSRRSDCVVGDRVVYRMLNSEQAVIESMLPRNNSVTRSDDFRSKTIAANIDLAGIVISGYPHFDEAILVRVLIALESERIPCMLIATKQDLKAAREAVAAREDLYRSLGYPVMTTAAKSDAVSLQPLAHRLLGQQTLLLGESGMGKSTLVNALVPGARQQTAAISDALASGRHATSFTRAFSLPGGGWLIDSPGFQAFEIAHLSRWQIVHAMPEFRPLLGHCRFNDCGHGLDAGCAIHAAAQEGRIDRLRYRLFTGIANRVPR